jgi:hypothetical protein
MICLSCKKQIPDDSDRCPYCGAEVFHKNQLVKEIGFRRYQRWIFYCLFFFIFAGAVGIILRVYSINSKLLTTLSDAQSNLSQRQAELSKAQSDLNTLQATKNNLESQNKAVSDDLNAKLAAAQKVLDEETAKQNSKASSSNSSLILHNIFSVAGGITNTDLAKIPLADTFYQGTDTDGDGLPDDLEVSLGTSATSTDTDSDSYLDRAEFISGFDPLVKNGKLPINESYAAAQKDKIFVQTGNYLWYVGADAKRYYIGRVE